MLNDYEAPSIDPGVDDSIREFIDRKKASFPDSNV
jgi:trimethylamine--corrinoid protein Co-methyltransferase